MTCQPRRDNTVRGNPSQTPMGADVSPTFFSTRRQNNTSTKNSTTIASFERTTRGESCSRKSDKSNARRTSFKKCCVHVYVHTRPLRMGTFSYFSLGKNLMWKFNTLHVEQASWHKSLHRRNVLLLARATTDLEFRKQISRAWSRNNLQYLQRTTIRVSVKTQCKATIFFENVLWSEFPLHSLERMFRRAVSDEIAFVMTRRISRETKSQLTTRRSFAARDPC